jgi:hypothetical protein
MYVARTIIKSKAAALQPSATVPRAKRMLMISVSALFHGLILLSRILCFGDDA